MTLIHDHKGTLRKWQKPHSGSCKGCSYKSPWYFYDLNQDHSYMQLDLETFFFQDFAGKLSYNHTREEISMDYARKLYHKTLQNKLLCDHTRCALKFISDLFNKIIQEILCRSYS